MARGRGTAPTRRRSRGHPGRRSGGQARSNHGEQEASPAVRPRRACEVAAEGQRRDGGALGRRRAGRRPGGPHALSAGRRDLPRQQLLPEASHRRARQRGGRPCRGARARRGRVRPGPLEAVVQLRARRLGGLLGERRYRSYLDRIERLRDRTLQVRDVAGHRLERRLRQQKSSARARPLAGPAARGRDGRAGLRRLMTTDVAQARAAEALGFEVVRPGRP